jgi:hypothetical protein
LPVGPPKSCFRASVMTVLPAFVRNHAARSE